jgi:hypothetical protein
MKHVNHSHAADLKSLAVKAVLTKHVADGGTIRLAADAWTKKRRKFIATVA